MHSIFEQLSSSSFELTRTRESPRVRVVRFTLCNPDDCTIIAKVYAYDIATGITMMLDSEYGESKLFSREKAYQRFNFSRRIYYILKRCI